MKERELKLLRGQVAVIDEGDFDVVNQYRWHLNGGYPVARIDGAPICLHVFLLGRAPDGFHIDHINRIKLDNRRLNLRIVTAAENIRNRRSYVGTSNPFSGKTHTATFKKKNAERCAKPIAQLNEYGGLIREWPSAIEAQRKLGISNANINLVANGLRATAGGFSWRFV